MRKIKIILLFIMVTFLAVGCIDNKIMKKEISLDSIGSQGDIRQDYVAFQILDNSFMGLRSLCVKKSVVSNLFSDYSKCHLNINGTYFYLNENPFNNNILEVDLPDSLTEENIRKGILTTSPAKKNTSTSARSGISIDSIVIQKEETQNNSDLFRIAASLFTSMRNANIFVFNKQGDFIIPSYIFTSEENCYMVSTFISARNASPNPSINGTFEFLKSLQNHNELLQHINPNTARYENGKIVIYPPNGKKRLRDLGSEGELNLQSSVYNIVDLRGSLGLWSVAFRKSRLSEPEKNGTDWKITLKNTEYLFTQNIVDGDIYELTIPDSITNDIEEIRNSTFETVEDQVTITVEASPTNGGDVRIGTEAWGDNKSKTFNSGESVTIEASCSSDYFFDGWYENQIKISTSNPFVITVSSNRNIEARFDLLSNPTIGTKKWEFVTGGEISSSPAIGTDGTIYVGSSDNKLYAINPNGSKKWEFTAGGCIYEQSIGSDGTIYVGSSDDKLYAINPNGSKKWEFITGDSVISNPAIGADGTIYIGSKDNKLYAINSNGSKKWEFKTGNWIFSSPAIGADGTIYVGSYDNKLYAINPDGSKKWEFETGDWISSSPAIGADGTIYIGSSDNKLYAIRADGSKKWEFETGDTISSAGPVIGADGTIYIGSSDNKLYAIRADGSKKWEFTTGYYILTAPAIGADGTIYIGSSDRKLYAIRADGSKKWEFMAKHWIRSSPSIGTDGTIYIGSGSSDRRIYAINSESGGLANTPWPKFGQNLKNTGRNENIILQVTISIEASPTTGGDVRIGTEAWGDNKSKTFNSGDSVTIEASCSSDYLFDGWYENGTRISSDNPYSFNLDNDRDIKANFVEKEPGLVFHISFDDNTAKDVSGNGHDGVLDKGAINTVDGIKGKAIDISGDTVIRIADHDDLDTDEQMTLLFWYKKKTGGENTQIPISKWYSSDSAPAGDWCVIIGDNNGERKECVVTANNSKQYDVSCTSTVDNANWVLLAFTFNKGDIKLYKNSILKDSEKADYTSLSPQEYGTDYISIGDVWKHNYSYYGYLDEIRLYNYELTAQKINEIYNNEKPAELNHSLTVESSPTNGGDVRIGTEEWGDSKSKTFNSGDSATIEASANSDYKFEGWYENETRISTDNPYTFAINENRNIKSNFIYIIPLQFVEIPAGTFMMGNTRDDSEGYSDEKPVHQVTLTYDYEIGKYEVTNAQFLEFLNDSGVTSTGQLNGNEVIDMDGGYCEIEYSNNQFRLKQSKAGKENYPVIEVTWWGAMEYCNWLSEKKGLSKAYNNDGSLNDYPNNKGYRLPTEAEWEYAARGAENDDNASTDYKYAGSNNIDEVAWYLENSTNDEHPMYEGKGTHQVGTKVSNESGIYDMSGNVWEWCQDYYNSGYYGNSPVENPINTTSSSWRVLRGGGWDYYAWSCRVAYRNNGYPPSYSYYSLGFRLVRTKSENTTQNTLTIEASPTNGGDVRIGTEAWGDSKSKTFNSGDSVTIEASATSGYVFEGWYDGNTKLTTDNPYTFSIYGSKSLTAIFRKNNGVFKIANSWGVGFSSWENVPDGFLYMTYEAVKANNVYAAIVTPRENYHPKAVALIKIEHQKRDECSFEIGITNTDRKIYFPPSYCAGRSGPVPYKDDYMVADITELLPINNQNIYMKIIDDNKTSETGILRRFEIEVYSDYDLTGANYIDKYTCNTLPLHTIDGSSVAAEISNVTASQLQERSQRNMNFVSEEINEQNIEYIKNVVGVRKGEIETPVINGFGTGLVPPSEEEWEYLLKTKNIRILKEYIPRSELMPLRVDNSESKYFPPIGSQAGKGACVSFSIGYYTGTFYTARNNNWDLSDVSWAGGRKGYPSGDLDKIMSPQFLFHQLNYANPNSGSSYLSNLFTLAEIGCSSWEKTPYDSNNYSEWPSGLAWREAPLHRQKEGDLFWMEINTDKEIETVKNLLKDGYLISISIDANKYSELTSEDLWTVYNYVNPDTNHANTIVGYSDY